VLATLPNNMSGYLVKSVAKDSPGDWAGLRGGNRVATIDGQQVVLGGDIVLSVDGMQVTAANIPKIRDHMNNMKPGDPFKTSVLRAGKVIELTGKAP
jgi:serine protease Do